MVRAGVGGSASYFTNRAEFYFNHSASFTGLPYSGPLDPYTPEERSAVGIGTSLVYADGAWGMGRPVTSGFSLSRRTKASRAVRLWLEERTRCG